MIWCSGPELVKGWKQSHSPMDLEEQNTQTKQKKKKSELCPPKVSSDCMLPTATTATKNRQTKDTKQTNKQAASYGRRQTSKQKK